MKINFFVNEVNISQATPFFDRIIKAYKMALKTIRQKGKRLEINITFLNNAEIQAINNFHRNIDKPTDVLSFPLLEINGKKLCKKNFPSDYNSETKTILIGDVFISLEKAFEQAKQFNHSLLREVVFLAVHGLLHCLGFDHETKDDEKIMFHLQDYILNRCGVKR